MATNPNSQYPPPATNAPTPASPYGSAANESSPGALDGFPFEQAGINDVLGFIQAVLRAVGVAPSGTSETAEASQVMAGLQQLATSGNYFEDTGAADAYEFSTLTNQQGPLAYKEGMVVRGIIQNENLTATPTLNVNALGVQNISGVAIGDLKAGTLYAFRYDGANFVVDQAAVVGDFVLPVDSFLALSASGTGATELISLTNPNGKLAYFQTSGTGIGLRLLDSGYNFIVKNSANADLLKITGEGIITGPPSVPIAITTGATNGALLDNNGTMRFSRSSTLSPWVRFYGPTSPQEKGSFAPDGSAFRINASRTLKVYASNSTSSTFIVDQGNSSYGGEVTRLVCQRSANSGYDFMSAFSDNGSDREFRLRGDGNGYCDGSWTGGGADYAICREWADGNPDNEDRIGVSVIFIADEKMRPAVDREQPDGVISATYAYLENSEPLKWKGKYL